MTVNIHVTVYEANLERKCQELHCFDFTMNGRGHSRKYYRTVRFSVTISRTVLIPCATETYFALKMHKRTTHSMFASLYLFRNHPLIIPFRECKLTRLFQGFFLGKGKACMVVNISQCASVFDETYNVLKFSAIAKQVRSVF